jgi:hypothetical protein
VPSGLVTVHQSRTNRNRALLTPEFKPSAFVERLGQRWIHAVTNRSVLEAASLF